MRMCNIKSTIFLDLFKTDELLTKRVTSANEEETKRNHNKWIWSTLIMSVFWAKSRDL